MFMLIHLSFEQWLLKLLKNGELGDIIEVSKLRNEYILQCERDEILWKKWSNHVK